MRIAPRRILATLAIALLALTAAAAAAPTEDPRDAAIVLYDQGRYPEARIAFQALDTAGKADGSALYRLAFCASVAGEDAEHASILARAVTSLEKETAADGSIEAWFYLSNAYRNLGRIADSTRVAADTASRLEAGKWKEPVRGVDLFRIAKLYADQGRDDKASAWYLKTIEALAPEASKYPAYVRWARRYLGDLAMSRMEWEKAAKAFGELVAIEPAQPADVHNLAVACVRLGRWQEAADAWKLAGKIDVAGGDDANYSRQLALSAAAIGSLPALTPDGRTWDLPSKEELETLLIEQAKVAQEAHPAALDGSGTAPAVAPPPDLAARLKEARRIFVAAGLEYAARGLPIRETAFTKGFAALVFHPEQWEIAAPAPGP
jgi:tetratricopeptide (TPR) repeat protein